MLRLGCTLLFNVEYYLVIDDLSRNYRMYGKYMYLIKNDVEIVTPHPVKIEIVTPYPLKIGYNKISSNPKRIN